MAVSGPSLLMERSASSQLGPEQAVELVGSRRVAPMKIRMPKMANKRKYPGWSSMDVVLVLVS